MYYYCGEQMDKAIGFLLSAGKIYEPAEVFRFIDKKDV